MMSSKMFYIDRFGYTCARLNYIFANSCVDAAARKLFNNLCNLFNMCADEVRDSDKFKVHRKKKILQEVLTSYMHFILIDC